MKQIYGFLFVLIFAIVLGSQPAGRETVGRQADGTVLLPNGWKIAPVGEQVPLDTLPMSSAISPNGRFVLVLNGGYKPPSVSVIDAASKKELYRMKVPDGWLGLTFSPDGKFVYVGGGSRYRVFEFSFSNEGELKPSREFEIAPDAPHTVRDFIGDVAVSADGQLMFAADLYHDSVLAINVRTGKVSDRYKTGRRPYRILFHPDGKTFFVSSWADATVTEYNVSSGTEVQRLHVGPHPTDMILSNRTPEEEEAEENAKKPKKEEKTLRLFVAAANTNTVFVVNVEDDKEMKVTETLNVALTPRHPLGMTPTALAISADQKVLFTVCSDANAVAVTDISGQRSRLMGFIPTGWYPTAARVLKDGTILVLNGRGLQSFPNPKAPGPFGAPAVEGGGDPRREYVGNLQTGTMSVIAPLTGEALGQYTKSTIALSPYNDSKLDVAELADDNVIYSKPGRPSPIEHVIYIIKENRTYDQVLGKLGKGNSDPTLDLFDENSAPNHYKLAREFVLFDNFYVNADVSADGHNWATAGIAPDYTQKFWPSSYAKRRNFYDYEGGEPANSPPAGYIWSNAVAAGLSTRNYGHQANNKKEAGADGVQITGVRDPSLASITNPRYRGFDLDYPDVERAKVFLGELKEFEGSGNMPRFIIMRLGNDHTSGTAAGHVAPLSSFADNDYALGMIVEGVSKSKFWAKTAIFVIEDDAQNGPDHVDSHRSPVFALSPYTRRGIIDSSMYNQSSVLRTMELILGLRPLTHFDAGARPMAMAFASAPNMAPYEAEKPRISLTEKNPVKSATAGRSAKMDFSDADLADDDELNAILWEAIRGDGGASAGAELFFEVGLVVSVESESCAICSRPPSDGVTVKRGLGNRLRVECPQCGKYDLVDLSGIKAGLDWTPEFSGGLSCAARQASEAGQPLKITAANAAEFAQPHIKTRVSDNQERLLREIAIRAGRPHNGAWLSAATDFTIIDCQSRDEFMWYVKWLTDEHLAFPIQADSDRTQFTLSPEGWKRTQPVPRQGGIPGRCFVAMWFDDSMNEVFELGISRAVVDCGLPAPIRIDQKEHNNQITDEIMAAIRDSEFVIADFSGNRGGVYYEAGFARGLGRPVIHSCRDSDFEDRHFDTKLINHVKWSDAADLRKKLANRIKATIIPKG